MDESSSVDNNEEISKAADETPDKDSLPIGGVEYLEEKIEQIEEKMEGACVFRRFVYIWNLSRV